MYKLFQESGVFHVDVNGAGGKGQSHVDAWAEEVGVKILILLWTS